MYAYSDIGYVDLYLHIDSNFHDIVVFILVQVASKIKASTKVSPPSMKTVQQRKTSTLLYDLLSSKLKSIIFSYIFS